MRALPRPLCKKGPHPKPGVRKTVSVPAVMSAGTILAYIVAV